MNHPITGSMMYDLVMCPHRPTMDLFGDPDSRDKPNPFIELLWEKGLLHERETIAALEVPVTDLSEFRGDEKERLTAEAIARGDPLIYSGRVRADELLGEPDLLRLVEGGYEAGDIKSGVAEEGVASDRKPKKHYAMQLALYTDILERLGISPGNRRGFIWDRNRDDVSYDLAAPQGVKKKETFWDDYTTLLALARAIVSETASTMPAYSSATCKLCHWYTACLERLEESRDLTLIHELGRAKRDALAVNFASLPEFAAADPQQFIRGTKTIFAGIGPDTLVKLHKRAQLAMTPGAVPYAKQQIDLLPSELEVFFDIETDPMRELCYLHGFVERRNGDNNAMVFKHFFATGIDAEAERECFAAAWAYVSSLPAGSKIYYYSKYERTIWRQLREKYPEVCEEADIEEFFAPTRAIDLYYDVVLKDTEWPTRDFSIKTLASHLGFAWRDTHPSGTASIEWYDQWVQTREDAIKQRILDYNEDDCKATAILLDGIRTLPIRS